MNLIINNEEEKNYAYLIPNLIKLKIIYQFF